LLIGGADTSGNWNHLSIIIGEEQFISQIYKELEYSAGIHMRMLPKKIKDRIVRKLHIHGDVFCLCIIVNKSLIIGNIEKRMRGYRRESLKKHIEKQYHYVLFTEINKICKEFLLQHHTSITEIVFEIDNDLRKFFSLNGIKCCNPSRAHEVSDVIAYCNTTSKNLEKVVERDISNLLENSLSRRLNL
jgi:hypothetical protein